jgi:hypothetical protein
MFSINEGVSPSHRPPVKPSRRRDKQQLSCTICRQKKLHFAPQIEHPDGFCLRIDRLKCDRVKPCLNCTKRGQPESCEYVKHNCPGPHPAAQHGIASVQERVQQLEGMVKALLNGQTTVARGLSSLEKPSSSASPIGLATDGGFTQSTAPSPYSQTDPDLPKPSMGKFTGEKYEASFVGGEHWEAILENIAELKIDLETPDTTEMLDFKPQLLFGRNHASRSEIMSSIPSKPICDVLISRWYKQMDMASSKSIVLLADIQTS